MEEVRAVCSPSQITQLYAALLYFVGGRSDLTVTDTAPKGGHAPILFGILDMDFQEHSRLV
jgi:uncharacterized protein (DUF169 family)